MMYLDDHDELPDDEILLDPTRSTIYFPIGGKARQMMNYDGMTKYLIFPASKVVKCIFPLRLPNRNKNKRARIIRKAWVAKPFSG